MSFGGDADATSSGGAASSSVGDTSFDPDSGGGSSGAIDCTPPPPDPAWLLPQLQDTVARLSGAAELGGTLLPDRATVARRALVAAFLFEQLDALGLQVQTHDYGTGTNVIARVPATGASAGTYVVGAHYDSVPDAPGADDNATGVAVVTALARHLASLPCRSHDVLVVAFDEEEVGLVGSTAFAAKLVADREPVVAVHTIDQIGYDADGDRNLELERPDAGLFEFYADVADGVPQLGTLVMTDTGFTDHVAFREAGFIAVGLSEEYASGDTTPHYHLPSDTYDTVEFGLVQTAATLVNHAFATALADA
jgi:hypothetical protein